MRSSAKIQHIMSLSNDLKVISGTKLASEKF